MSQDNEKEEQCQAKNHENPSITNSEELDSLVFSLKEQLNITNLKLESCEREKCVLQCRLQNQQDVLERIEVKNLVCEYKQQVKGLNERITLMKQNNPVLQSLENNSRIKQRNEVLSHTNSCLAKQNTEHLSKLNCARTEIVKLKEELQQLLLYHPGGDAEGAVDAKVVDATVNTPPAMTEVSLLQNHLSQYYKLLMLSHRKNSQQAAEYMVIIDSLKDDLAKLTRQIEVVAQERDEVEMKLKTNCNRPNQERNISGSDDIPPPASTSAYNVNDLNVHILEQESKIQKLTISLGDNEQQNSQLFEQLRQIQEDNKAKDQKITEMQKEVDINKKKLNAKSQEEKQEEKQETYGLSIIREQLRAFQDDFCAEREEKQRILEDAKRIRDENTNLKHELQSRSSQFSPPPSMAFENAVSPSGIHMQQPLDINLPPNSASMFSHSAGQIGHSIVQGHQPSMDHGRIQNTTGTGQYHDAYERPPVVRPNHSYPQFPYSNVYNSSGFTGSQVDPQHSYYNPTPMNQQRFMNPNSYTNQDIATPRLMNSNEQVSPPQSSHIRHSQR